MPFDEDFIYDDRWGESDHVCRTTLSRMAMLYGREVAIPDGFIIAKGRIKLGDMYIDCVQFREHDEIVWHKADPHKEGYDHTASYGLPIRPIKE